MTRPTWVRTVAGDRKSTSATSALERPVATQPAISRSIVVVDQQHPDHRAASCRATSGRVTGSRMVTSKPQTAREPASSRPSGSSTRRSIDRAPPRQPHRAGRGAAAVGDAHQHLPAQATANGRADAAGSRTATASSLRSTQRECQTWAVAAMAVPQTTTTANPTASTPSSRPGHRHAPTRITRWRLVPLLPVATGPLFGYGGLTAPGPAARLVEPGRFLDFTAGWAQMLGFAANAVRRLRHFPCDDIEGRPHTRAPHRTLLHALCARIRV